MTKAELVVAVSEHAGMERRDAQKAVDAFVGCLTQALRNGDAVRIVGFGNFTSVHRPAGTARNPKTGAKVSSPATRLVRFRASEAFRAAVQK